MEYRSVDEAGSDPLSMLQSFLHAQRSPTGTVRAARGPFNAAIAVNCCVAGGNEIVPCGNGCRVVSHQIKQALCDGPTLSGLPPVCTATRSSSATDPTSARRLGPIDCRSTATTTCASNVRQSPPAQ